MLPLRHLPADRHPAQGSGQLPGPSGHRPGATPGRAHTQLSGFAGGHCGSLRAPPPRLGDTQVGRWPGIWVPRGTDHRRPAHSGHRVRGARPPSSPGLEASVTQTAGGWMLQRHGGTASPQPSRAALPGARGCPAPNVARTLGFPSIQPTGLWLGSRPTNRILGQTSNNGPICAGSRGACYEGGLAAPNAPTSGWGGK